MVVMTPVVGSMEKKREGGDPLALLGDEDSSLEGVGDVQAWLAIRVSSGQSQELGVWCDVERGCLEIDYRIENKLNQF